MTDYKAQQIPNDTERRAVLNREMNPRTTVMGEATQRLNPLTGREYEDSLPLSLMIDGPWGFTLDPKEKTLIYMPGHSPERSDILDYQFALARMDVRDGKMSREAYQDNKNLARTLVMRLQNANVPLSSISSPEGLDNALADIEAQNERRGIQFLPKSSYRNNLGDSIIHYPRNEISYIPKTRPN